VPRHVAGLELDTTERLLRLLALKAKAWFL
jgi:hypothetical protein